jgi:streptogramin lyase
MTWCSVLRVAISGLAVALGCLGRQLPAQATWQGRVDTLPSGTIVVSNPAQGLWDAASAWRAVEDLRIGSVDGDGAAAFARIASLAVDADGRIYILDRQAQDVRVFAHDGRHLRTIGRKGRGPGEFQDADAIAVDASGRLWVSDRMAHRFSSFDTAGRFLADHPRAGPGFFPDFVGGAQNGELWDAWSIYDSPNHLKRRELLQFSEGTYRDTVVLPDFAQPQWQIVRRQGAGTQFFNFPVPFTAEELLAADPVGSVWRAISTEYRLTQLTRDGDSARVILREHRPLPVTARDRERATARYRRDFADAGAKLDESLIPPVKPAMRVLLVDNLGFVWVAPFAADDSAAIAFDVFDPEGRYLGAVPTPVTPQRLRPLPVVRGNALYYVTTDELDVPYVVRARIVGRD